MKKIKDDLNAEFLNKKFRTQLPVNQSRMAAVAAIRQAIRGGRIAQTDPSAIDSLISQDKFVRIGFVIHEQNAVLYDYGTLLSELRAEPGAEYLSTIVMDVTVEKIRAFTDIITYLEKRSDG